jgi:hypothetical protein
MPIFYLLFLEDISEEQSKNHYETPWTARLRRPSVELKNDFFSLLTGA